MVDSNASDYSALVGAFRGYVSPVIAILGILGNIFIIIVFIPESPRSRFSVYAMFLAVANGITLITNTLIDDFMGRGLHYATGQKIYYKVDSASEFSCKSVEYISNVMYFINSYILVIFSFDRILTIYRPIKFYSIYHKRYAILSCVIVYIAGFIANSPLLFVQTLVKDPASRTNFTCRMLEDHPVAKFTIGFEVVCIFAIPFFVVLILNSLICVQFAKLKHTRRRLLPADRIRSRLEMSRVTGHLAMSTAFLLLYLPMVCFVLIRLHITLTQVDRYTVYAQRIIDLSKFFSSVKDITYAMNFLLYMVFLKNFRKRFIRIFRCKGPDPVASTFKDPGDGRPATTETHMLESLGRH
ncbi:unnamed protein product [Calicophoron daubneyi]|uniref:G-protein coupled receptors family 1 profile domain-containing protein n=1 Tax=Calicophoron daubneyi TaxID=300641 RepID=A0AAV2TRM8_CALDB